MRNDARRACVRTYRQEVKRESPAANLPFWFHVVSKFGAERKARRSKAVHFMRGANLKKIKQNPSAPSV